MSVPSVRVIRRRLPAVSSPGWRCTWRLPDGGRCPGHGFEIIREDATEAAVQHIAVEHGVDWSWTL